MELPCQLRGTCQSEGNDLSPAPLPWDGSAQGLWALLPDPKPGHDPLCLEHEKLGVVFWKFPGTACRCRWLLLGHVKWSKIFVLFADISKGWGILPLQWAPGVFLWDTLTSYSKFYILLSLNSSDLILKKIFEVLFGFNMITCRIFRQVGCLQLMIPWVT